MNMLNTTNSLKNGGAGPGSHMPAVQPTLEFEGNLVPGEQAYRCPADAGGYPASFVTSAAERRAMKFLHIWMGAV